MARYCRACNEGWEIAEGDRFCGFCGTPTRRLVPEVQAGGTICLEDLADLDGEVEVVVRLTNHGTLGISLADVRARLLTPEA